MKATDKKKIDVRKLEPIKTSADATPVVVHVSA
jgi:hypothetical protein